MRWWSIAGVIVIVLNIVAGAYLATTIRRYVSTAQIAPVSQQQLATTDVTAVALLARSFGGTVISAMNTLVEETQPASSPSSTAGVSPDPSSPVTGLSTGGQQTSTSLTAGRAYQSSNWSGYVATGSSYTSVSGSWTVPSPSPTSRRTYSADAAWIGIGGVSSSDLIQTGTTDLVSPNGTISVVAFYELLPSDARYITSLNVSPGDVMTASIQETSNGVWNISLTDTTTGQAYTNTVNYNSSHSTAEWIQEAPSLSSGGIFPLDDFGTINFTGASATAAGKNTSIASLATATMTMTNSSGYVIASPSALSGTGFSVTYQG